jgi:hypothetical protein
VNPLPTEITCIAGFSFNGKPQAPVFYWLSDACGLPLNEETVASVPTIKINKCFSHSAAWHE